MEASDAALERDTATFFSRLWRDDFAIAEQHSDSTVDLGPSELQKWAAQYISSAGISVALSKSEGGKARCMDSTVVLLTSEDEVCNFLKTDKDSLVLPDPSTVYGFYVTLSYSVAWRLSKTASAPSSASSSRVGKRTRGQMESADVDFCTHEVYEIAVERAASNAAAGATLAYAVRPCITVLFQLTKESMKYTVDDDASDYKAKTDESGLFIVQEVRIDCVFTAPSGLSIMKVCCCCNKPTFS
jgi:hypothetical protein